jgi:hypothetical protein
MIDSERGSSNSDVNPRNSTKLIRIDMQCSLHPIFSITFELLNTVG